MDCARNIITANFSGGTSATTAPLWQWDYGQVLCVTGIEDLPAAFEVHFSTNKTGGVSTVAVGADGRVTIPNVLLTIGKNLNAWIYLSDAQGEGETEYSILIPVKARPMPETYDAEVSGEFDDVVRQVSEYAETAQTAADNAGASATAAAASADNAAASASAAETAKTAAETAQGKAEDAQAAAETAAQTATEKAQQTEQDAAQAAQSKADAESAADRAEAAQTGAESAKTDAETAAQGAADSASAASASAASAGQSATSAAQSATAAAQSAASIEGDVQTATQKAAEATAAADQAVAAKDAAVTAQHGAETAETNAGQSASTATTKAAEAAQSATDAAASKTAAEAAATRAETAAASLTVDSALSDSSVNPVQNRVVTESVTQLKNAIYEDMVPDGLSWSLGILGAGGSVSSGNGATSSIVGGMDSVSFGGGCRAVILLYKNSAYLGKLNASGGIDKSSGNWRYFTGMVNVRSLFEEFNANQLRVSVLPTDGTTITSDTVTTYGNQHCFFRKLLIVPQTVYDENKALTDLAAFITRTTSELYERKAVSASYNSYEYFTTEDVQRARIKKDYIQKIPANASSVTVTLLSTAFHGTDYSIAWGCYTADYIQINSSVKGWYKTAGTFTADIPANAVYFMLYIGANQATSIDLSVLDLSGCSVVFNNSPYNYIDLMYHAPVSEELKKAVENINITGIREDIADLTTELIGEKAEFIWSVNHRGYSAGAPENTLPAFIMSKKKGFQYVETDVAFTSDNVAVLLHDSTINRTARNADGTEISGTVSINSITYEQALTYDFGIWKGPEWAGTKIPTFEAFVQTCKQLSLHPFIELKDSVGGSLWTDAKIQNVADSIRKVGMDDHITFLSFAVSALSKMKAQFPKATLVIGLDGSYTDARFEQLITDAVSLKSADNQVFVSVNYENMTPDLYSDLTDADLNPMLWTVNSEAVALTLDNTVVGVLSDSLIVSEIIANHLISQLP